MDTSNPHEPTLQSMVEPAVELGPERAESAAHDEQGRLKMFLATYLRLRPIRAVEHDVSNLHELERAGETEWTPWIAMAGLVLFFVAIGLLVFGIVEAASNVLASAFLEG
jgi:hypothetical protein